MHCYIKKSMIYPFIIIEASSHNKQEQLQRSRVGHHAECTSKLEASIKSLTSKFIEHILYT